MTSHVTGSTGAYTWDDFIALDDEDKRELVDGELVEIEVTSTHAHERIVAELIIALGIWRNAGHGGQVLGSSYKIRVSERRGFMPDVQFYRAGNIPAADQSQGLTRGKADLVVEVASPSSRRFDRVKKLTSYASLGIPEYWLIEPEDRTLERLVLREGMYVVADALECDAVFRPDTFEGLEIPLAKLWA